MPSTSESEKSTLEGGLREGHVKWYSVAHGYGFLSADLTRGLPATEEAAPDIFVHHSVVGEREDLIPGERVRFAVEQGPKGLLATHLERIG